MSSDLGMFYGPNAGYVLDLYDQYQQDPNAVDPATRDFFAQWQPPADGVLPMPASSQPPAAGAALGDCDIAKIVGAARAARLIREMGHMTAHIDPLGSEPPGDPELELATHGISSADLAALPATVVGGPLAEGVPNALEAMNRLRHAYSGSVGYEDDHIQNPEERDWMREAAETGKFFQGYSDAEKRGLLERLTQVEGFEQFLDKTFLKVKRFSLEGTDMLVPMLDMIIHEASQSETHEVVMGMAHRGRLNVLAHILGKPYAAILQEFQAAHSDDNEVSGGGLAGYSGDVKYHQGARRDYSEHGDDDMPITLAPNPSHLEFVDPVVVGRARAAQEHRYLPGAPVQDPKLSLTIMIHGDAAFPGQGIVAETLNMSYLRGYSVGGTIHIIVNNQIGFTTLPSDDRSTLYASDLAKGFEIPIVHVNADDPLACIAVARMAHAYREKFGKDFLIDLVGYRRYGHNEGDDPSITQPRMYELINAHPTVRTLWAAKLEQDGVVTHEEADAMVMALHERLQKANAAQPSVSIQKPAATAGGTNKIPSIETAISAEQLTALNEALLVRPADFTPNAKLERILGRRREGLTAEKGIDWGHAEALAYASILQDGTPIRLSGQDAERGTFSHRHAVLHDPITGERYVPLQNLPQADASFAVYNSPLSENAVLGFEYGYSIHAREALVLWEAQFGDFGNGAQVIIDQFIVSGHAKWQQSPSLVLLLPHGYEGQGPEHSSARLERYLQLAANENIRVANLTNSAQFFHLLRRQAALLQFKPRPLIVMTPKSLLREPLAGSSLGDLTQGTFQAVIDDASARERADEVTRLILCSGKVYIDLIKNPKLANSPRIAAARIEELYPFPAKEIQRVVAGYPNLREIIWLQEEPRNMGAWRFLSTRLREAIGPIIELIYVGRPESGSPAEGFGPRHKTEQTRIISVALDGAPVIKDITRNGARETSAETLNGDSPSKSKRSEPSHAR